VQRDPRDAVAHRLLYDSQIGAGDFQTAAITLDLVERLSPGNGEVQVAMAWFYAACPDVARRNPSRALHHARAAERFLGPSNPDAAMATTLAAASAGDSRLATSAARRGAASARERGDADLLAEFERLLGLVDGRRAIAARPRLLARR